MLFCGKSQGEKMAQGDGLFFVLCVFFPCAGFFLLFSFLLRFLPLPVLSFFHETVNQIAYIDNKNKGANNGNKDVDRTIRHPRKKITNQFCRGDYFFHAAEIQLFTHHKIIYGQYEINDKAGNKHPLVQPRDIKECEDADKNKTAVKYFFLCLSQAAQVHK